MECIDMERLEKGNALKNGERGMPCIEDADIPRWIDIRGMEVEE